jgi:hypothetical protein
MSHTPTPWKVFTSPDGLLVVGIGTLEGEGVCDAGFGVWRWNDGEGIANAHFIVRAVNSHADMLAALKAIIPLIDVAGYTDRRDEEAIRQARAAIAKAEQ